MSYHVFISWSGKRSGLIAKALSAFLEKVFEPDLTNKIFLSSRDIRGGARWSEQINNALRECKFGVVCLTPENKSAPWPLFEAGALSKTAGEALVCPYLHDLIPDELGRPLEQFIATNTTKEGTYKLVQSINTSLGGAAHTATTLEAIFEFNWQTLESAISAVPT